MNMNIHKTFRGDLHILEMGTWTPDEIINSFSLQADIGKFPMTGGFDLIEKAGIVERRAASANTSVLDMAELASIDAISNASNAAGFSAESIDTIIYSSVFRMYSEPATATLLQKRLGINSAISFDVSNACLGFIDGLIIADSLIKSGISGCVLVAGAEKGSHVLRNSHKAIMENGGGNEYLASLTLGDGAAAAIVCPENFSEYSRLRLKGFTRTTLSDYAECCILPSQEHPMSTDSAMMFEGAIQHYPDMFRKLTSDLGWDIDDFDVIIPHQASLKIIRKAMDAISFPYDRCAVTLDSFGNMGSVSIPFTLKHTIDKLQLAKGGRVGVLGFGSGLSFSMMALEVNNPSGGACLPAIKK